MGYLIWYKNKPEGSWFRFGAIPRTWEACLVLCRNEFWEKKQIAEIFEEDDHPNTDTTYIVQGFNNPHVKQCFTKEECKIYAQNSNLKKYYIKEHCGFFIKQ